MSIFRRIRSRTHSQPQKSIFQKARAATIAGPSPPAQIIKEEHFGEYHCSKCKEKITVYRQYTSDPSTPPPASGQAPTQDFLRFEHQSTTNFARRVSLIPFNSKRQLSQARERVIPISWRNIKVDPWIDEQGKSFELLSEVCLGIVVCAKCNEGLHLWSQVRRFVVGELGLGEDIRWGLSKESRAGKCPLMTKEHLCVTAERKVNV